ncbi:MAG: hypothetical protein HN764_06475 [Gammaproteobacteria bacterium]|jgi:hypothetical protein|nr:hypothetical protein [Gammaproteobacteria bacterium]
MVKYLLADFPKKQRIKTRGLELMEEHTIGLKHIGFGVFAVLLVGFYVPDLLSNNYSTETGDSYCLLEKEVNPAPPRAWASEFGPRQELIAAL